MITSTQNQQVKLIQQLMKKPRLRREHRLYVVEGPRMFEEAPEEQIHSIYVSESWWKDPSGRQMLNGRKYEILSDSVFSHVSDTKTPQGVLCLMKMPEYDLDEMLKRENGLWLVLENIQDPGNLGTMFRTGEGAGVCGVIMDSHTVDIYNPKTIRSTMGSIYRVPFAVADDLDYAIAQMKDHKIRLYAAHLDGSASYDTPDYCAASAFLIGNEGNGLTAHTASLADTFIRIPMNGKLESLNAAMAAGILMYEANRQRRKEGSHVPSLGEGI